MARPKKKIEISPEQYVSDLASLQCSKVEVAARLNISVDSLDRRYAAEYEKGRQLGRSKLREKLYQTALSGNVAVMIFMAKSVLGLRETQSLELSGPAGSPISINDARQHLASLLDGIAARQPAGGDPEPADRG